jgi:hypothetical protein
MADQPKRDQRREDDRRPDPAQLPLFGERRQPAPGEWLGQRTDRNRRRS